MGDRRQASKPFPSVTIHRGRLRLVIRPWAGTVNNSETWGVNSQRTTLCISSVSVASHTVSWCLADGYKNEDHRRPVEAGLYLTGGVRGFDPRKR